VPREFVRPVGHQDIFSSLDREALDADRRTDDRPLEAESLEDFDPCATTRPQRHDNRVGVLIVRRNVRYRACHPDLGNRSERREHLFWSSSNDGQRERARSAAAQCGQDLMAEVTNRVLVGVVAHISDKEKIEGVVGGRPLDRGGRSDGVGQHDNLGCGPGAKCRGIRLRTDVHTIDFSKRRVLCHAVSLGCPLLSAGPFLQPIGSVEICQSPLRDGLEIVQIEMEACPLQLRSIGTRIRQSSKSEDVNDREVEVDKRQIMSGLSLPRAEELPDDGPEGGSGFRWCMERRGQDGAAEAERPDGIRDRHAVRGVERDNNERDTTVRR